MRPKRYIVAALALSVFGFGSMSPPALAFEETAVGAGTTKAPAAPVLELPKDLPKGTGEPGTDAAKGLGLQIAPGTEVRIPGLGTVGVLPKLDFGLELLYGANEQKGPFQDKSESDDVQLRGTIKHRF